MGNSKNQGTRTYQQEALQIALGKIINLMTCYYGLRAKRNMGVNNRNDAGRPARHKV